MNCAKKIAGPFIVFIWGKYGNFGYGDIREWEIGRLGYRENGSSGYRELERLKAK